MGRILAVDPGKKRVGLALSDALKMIASPFKLLNFENQEKLVQELCSVIREKDVERVVIGFPVREDGQESTGCEEAKQLLELLKKENIDAVLWDERYSSKIAQGILRESGIKAKNAKGKLDALAASVLLENYLAFYKRNNTTL
ncbi:MAG: Holliday junction resolvase RuvX [Spirochaetales bacterium]|nr:Holliday junction resolvase RuvX [Spirochaetales bacterium]